MSTAVIYVRISRDAEGEALGVERQLEDCLALAEREGLTVVQQYVENDTGASSKSRKPRPEYAAMLAGAKAGAFTTVLAYSNSRLTRRPREYEDWIDLYPKVQVRTVVSGQHDLSKADGRAVARTVAAWDAAEAERTSERVLRAKQQAKEAGKWLGGRRPYGLEKDGVTVRPDEAAQVLRAAQGLLAGRSLRAMAAEFAMVGTSGRPVDGMALRRILQNDATARILEPEIRARVVALLADPTRKTTTTPDRKWLLSGIATCSVCNETVHSHSGSGRARSYTCQAKHVARDLAQVDAKVRGLIAKRLVALDLADLLPVSAPDTMQADAAEAEQIRADLSGLAQAQGHGHITLAQMVQSSQILSGRLTALEARLAQAYQAGPLGALVATCDPSAAFEAAPLDIQRQVVALLCTVTISPGRRGRPKGWIPGMPYCDLETVQVAWRTAPAGDEEPGSGQG